jgi:hypothetical protein
MSGVFRNIDPPPSPPSECVYPPPHHWYGAGGRTHSLGGGGVNSSEDARHCSVLFICKYFVVGKLATQRLGQNKRMQR